MYSKILYIRCILTNKQNPNTIYMSSVLFFTIGLVWLIVFNATFNNISVISWWSVLLVEETRVPGENH